MKKNRDFDNTKKMCKLYKDYKEFKEEYYELVMKPKWVCKKCGRVSKSKENICKPDKLRKK